ncbi:MAG: right-handed parallel beta-helix repeat-containing protein [Thermoguttaceae bacterium]|jgi:hypothetical protein|nr:right-handed parallel beta-helix repeat-containing protein [Thermoguttaceae bacterium]
MKTSIRVFQLIVIALACVLACPARGAEYYLSPDGDDAAAGDRGRPWRSLEKANASLGPGDTLVLLPGEYTGVIAPAQSGGAGEPITYRSAAAYEAVLAADSGQPLIQLDGREHIAIEGLHVDGRGRAQWLRAADCRHLTLRNCRMRDTPRPMSITHSRQVLLLDNMFSADNVGGDMMWLEECSEVLIEGNSFTRIGHSPLTLNYCNNVAIRANVFRAEWGRNYITYSLGRALWEGNIITRARDSGGSASSRAHSFWDDGIFRHNRVFGNVGPPLNMGSYIWQGVSPTGRFRGPFGTMHSRFYNNTFADNIGEAWFLGGINVSANLFQNNIFHRNDWTGGNVQVRRADGISRDNRFVRNLFRGTEPGQKVVAYGSRYWTAEEANENTPVTGGFWSEFHENIDAEPGFLDPDNRDYRLAPGSAAIDAGAPIARAVGSGRGRQLPVSDGRGFYDGFDIEGEEGDFIAVGRGDNLAQIERVELRYYQPAILHLDREVAWEDEMPVSLPWTGDAPDLGAYEHGGEHPTRLVALARPAVVEPGQPVSFSLDTLGKEATSVTWDFEDGAFAHEPAATHTYAKPGHYGVTVRATFADGRRGVDVVFINVTEPEAPSTPLVKADFEDATRRTHWGYQFKFYRPHQTGFAHIPRPEGEGKCMRAFYDERKANQTAGQIAPGEWDIDRYPFIRFAYRIPAGVPVALAIEPFPAEGRPRGFVLGGTKSRSAAGYVDLGVYTLIDDGAWHEITLDVRKARESYENLKHLARFQFFTNWREDAGQEFWFDDFVISGE